MSTNNEIHSTLIPQLPVKSWVTAGRTDVNIEIGLLPMQLTHTISRNVIASDRVLWIISIINARQLTDQWSCVMTIHPHLLSFSSNQWWPHFSFDINLRFAICVLIACFHNDQCLYFFHWTNKRFQQLIGWWDNKLQFWTSNEDYWYGQVVSDITLWQWWEFLLQFSLNTSFHFTNILST